MPEGPGHLFGSFNRKHIFIRREYYPTFFFLGSGGEGGTSHTIPSIDTGMCRPTGS